ncbi:MAG: hypothetical protein IT307_04290 [Chloroflexi bacterium]|nr:hypothetical protein [Chloroflexota bacterium]
MTTRSFGARRLLATLLLVGGVATAPTSTSAAAAQPSTTEQLRPRTPPTTQNERVCGAPAQGKAQCLSRIIVDQGARPFAAAVPNGYGPLQFTKAYGLAGPSANTIVAIVDAYDHPNIQSDLDTYSDTFGIPRLPACTTGIAASTVPCFQKVDQNGGQSYPATNSGWAVEIALDVEVLHGICPACRILLVEADSEYNVDLDAAVDRAVALGARVVSNSYGSLEDPDQTVEDSHFDRLGIAFVASSGDDGYGVSYPASSRFVTAAGGTTLHLSSDSSYRGESVWSGSGSGCSRYESKPVWQTDSACRNRTVADVAADADPATGAAVYSSVAYQGRSGWFVVGGTSLSAPIVSAVYALAGPLPSSVRGNSVPYAQFSASNFRDVRSGRNGSCLTYLCKGVSGYDGPTGLGTPLGIGGFTGAGGQVIPTVTLSVQRTGTGSGRVSSTDGKINCGVVCTSDYLTGSAVQLTAVPTSGSTFTGWSGDCTGTGVSCSLALTADATATAAFGPKPCDAPTAAITKPKPGRQKSSRVSFRGTYRIGRGCSLGSAVWDFGDGSTASGKSSGHTFAPTSAHHVAFTVTDSAGQQATASIDISVP